MTNQPLRDAIERWAYLDWEYRLANGDQTLQIEVECADSRNPGNYTRVVHQYGVPPQEATIWSDPHYPFAFLRQCTQKTVLHEMDEWIRVDGQLLFDPHASDYPN